MKFTDIFVRRPVLSMVVSLLILVLGLHSIQQLPVRQFPKLDSTLITVTTSYPGASQDLIQGFITYPIQQSIATAEGIDYLMSTSTQGTSTIQAYIKLNYDPNVAFTDVMAKVAQVQNQLPKASQLPVITKSTGAQFDLLYAAFQSPNMSREQLTDYINRVILPNMETVPGVSEVDVFGGKVFSMRIWLDPARMSAFHVTNEDVSLALQANNYQSSAGHTHGEYITVNFQANTDINTVDEFKQLVIRKGQEGSLVRLQDVAKIQLGSTNYNSYVGFNGKEATFIGIQATPTANPLQVIDLVRQKLPQLEKGFPPGMTYSIVYDSTIYINTSIHEVIQTIIESSIIVILVIFLFLGSARVVFIPVITIPLSLVGVCTFMLFLGYSINLLTLLAMVLAIGLVVDDAIVVVENIHRHLEEGRTPFQAGIIGAREIASPVIVMTLTLACVFAPIGFLGGLTGALFKEFAFTLASSVIISGIIALTLSPMMTSKFLNQASLEAPLPKKIDAFFHGLKTIYGRLLHSVLEYRPAVVLFAIVVLISCFFLYQNTKQELAPDEDQGILFISGMGPQYANIDYMEKFSNNIDQIMAGVPIAQQRFTVVGGGAVNTMFAGLLLKPWDQRKMTAMQLNPILQKQVTQDAGLQTFVITPSALPGNSGGLPIQFILLTTADFKTLYKYSEALLAAARKSGYFMYIDSSLKFDQPQYNINIDASKASELGLSMQSIGSALSTALSENYINYFNMDAESYQVIPQLQRQFRFNAHDLDNIYMKTPNGQMVALSSVIHITQSTVPNQIAQFNQLNSATIEAMLMPGFSMGQGLKFLEEKSQELLPNNVSYDFASQSRQYVQEGNALLFVFILALIIIFLVLSAQFESFRDPLIILISVPMSICGALIPLNLGAATINIYTQIGLVTLIGLISKHGILMVQFANDLQRTEGLGIQEAIEKAAAIRLRPILMTTFAMVFGVVPLVFATGAGAVSRNNMGLVIAVGMSVGTLFTLFVLPTMYTLLATKKPRLTDVDPDADL